LFLRGWRVGVVLEEVGLVVLLLEGLLLAKSLAYAAAKTTLALPQTPGQAPIIQHGKLHSSALQRLYLLLGQPGHFRDHGDREAFGFQLAGRIDGFLALAFMQTDLLAFLQTDLLA